MNFSTMNMDYFNYATGLTMTNNKFAKLFNIKRREPENELSQIHMDIAASIQAVTEEIVLKITRFLFIFLVRPTPSVLRAAVMTLVILLARIRGERSLGVPSLGAAITMLILLDPFQAIDPGFALSVLATAGILFLSPRFEQRFELSLKPKFLLQAVSIPISATLFCLPVIILLSNEISSATVPSNILVAPVIAPITVLGFLSAIITPLTSDIGQVLFNIASFLANYIVFTSDLMADFPSLYFSNTKVDIKGEKGFFGNPD